MPKPRYLPWSRIAAVCRRMAKKARINMPEALETTGGDPFERDEKRLEALANFLEKAFPEKKVKEDETPSA